MLAMILAMFLLGSDPAPLALSALSLQDASPPPSTSQPSPEIDGILTRLEDRGNDVKDLRCRLKYTIEDKISLDKLIKEGSILFKRAEPHDVFLIHFEKLVQDGVTPKGRREWYLFKDRWLWEVKESTKSIIKRETVKPGEKVNLFDLETAPFPVPFGQKKDQILKNFDVSLAPPAADDPSNTDHLVCIPKPGAAMSKDYEKLEFYVSRELHLPIRVVATEVGGKKLTTADFPDLSTKSINAGLSDKDFAPSSDWKKYNTIEEPLAAKQPPPGR